jgi:hypothetical protein
VALLDDLRREVIQRGERIVRAATVQMQGDLRRDTPKVTGLLRKSTTVRVVSAGETVAAEAKAETPYAASVIEGARPHIIRAKKPGGSLVFFWPKVGRVVYFKQVSHPGNRPNPYWHNIMQRWGSYLQTAADRIR